MPSPPSLPPVHETMKTLRAALGLTQREFGERLGYESSYIAQVEGGRPPSPAFLLRVMHLTGMTPRLLFTPAVVGALCATPPDGDGVAAQGDPTTPTP